MNSVLLDAYEAVNGKRQFDYGHPLDDFSRTAKLWSAILGTSVSSEQVGLCMIALKVSRECNRHTRDNLVDIAGYAETIEMLRHERQRRGK